MIFAVLLMAAMTTAVVATVWLTSSLSRDERLYEDRIRSRYAFDAVCEQAAQDYTAGTLATFPTSRNVTVNGVVCAMTISDNSANIPHSLSISATMSYHNRTFTDTKVVGMRKTPSPFYYALFFSSMSGGGTISGALNTGSSGANGDVYFGGPVTLTGTGSTINGDLESTGSISSGTTSITGMSNANVSAVALPSVLASNYSSIANQTVSKASLAGATFTVTTGNYSVIYCSSSGVSISGTFTNKGTVFVNGNVTISGPISVANSSSRVAIVASGNITFTSSGPHNAYFYAAGSATLPAAGITITKGGLVAGSLTTVTAPITATNDTAVWLDSTEGTKHRLPGFYP